MNKRTIDVALSWAKGRGWNQSRLARLLNKTPADVTNWKDRGMPVEMDRVVTDLFCRTVEELYENARHVASKYALSTIAHRDETVEDICNIWDKLDPERQRQLVADAWDFLKAQEAEIPNSRNPFVRIPA